MFFRDVYGYVVCVCLYVDDIFSQWGGSDFEMDSQQLMDTNSGDLLYQGD